MSRRNASSTRRTTLSVLAAVLVLGLAWLGFRLLEPVLVWNFGWKPLPQIDTRQTLPPAAGFVDPQWQALAEPAALRLHQARATLETPALSAAISIGGRRVWASAVGLADVEHQRPVALDSPFRLGSTSKAVTSVAIGTLLDAGRLDLDVPVSTYLTDLPEPLSGITTRQAMSHTAGVRNYGMCFCLPIWEHLNRRPYASTRAALRIFERDALLFAPGEGFAYTSHGYNVAGAVMEAITEKSFGDYLQQAVFDPLGMTRSGTDAADPALSGLVSFYETKDGNYAPAFAVDNSNKWPSGGLLSTPTDMLSLGRAMMSDELLADHTRESLLTPQRLADGSDNPQGYALGWRVSDQRTLFDGTVTTHAFGHHGTAVGSTSYFAVLPEYDLVISVMMNRGQDNVTALAQEANALIELFIAELQRREAQVP